MKHFLTAAIVFLLASSQAVACSGIPGLSEVAAKLRVRAVSNPSFRALTDCAGKNYEIGSLLNAAVVRLERAEQDAIELRSQIAAMRAQLSRRGE